MPALRKRGALAQYVPPNAAAMGESFKGLGEDGYYYPTTSTLMLMIVNTAKVRPEEAPKSWSDLLDPKWKGRAAFGHPGFSGYVGVWTVQMRKMHGWKWFEALAANKPRLGRSGNDPITLLNAGECVVGLGPLSTSLASAVKGKMIDPARGGMPPIPGAKPIEEAKPHRLTTDELVKAVPEVIEQWRDTFG